MKNHSFWLKAAAFTQLLTGFFHVLGIIAETKPKNETEKTLLDLMSSYKFDLGAGFRHSMDDIMLAFSISFALLLFFSAAINYSLVKLGTDVRILKSVVLINIATYGICFVTMAMLTFLPPVICIGLVILFHVIGLYKLNKSIKSSLNGR